ncbi:hypothetical protein ES703_124532 [subsurface metagenome]
MTILADMRRNCGRWFCPPLYLESIEELVKTLMIGYKIRPLLYKIFKVCRSSIMLATLYKISVPFEITWHMRSSLVIANSSGVLSHFNLESSEVLI